MLQISLLLTVKSLHNTVVCFGKLPHTLTISHKYTNKMQLGVVGSVLLAELLWLLWYTISTKVKCCMNSTPPDCCLTVTPTGKQNATLIMIFRIITLVVWGFNFATGSTNVSSIVAQQSMVGQYSFCLAPPKLWLGSWVFPEGQKFSTLGDHKHLKKI